MYRRSYLLWSPVIMILPLLPCPSFVTVFVIITVVDNVLVLKSILVVVLVIILVTAIVNRKHPEEVRPASLRSARPYCCTLAKANIPASTRTRHSIDLPLTPRVSPLIVSSMTPKKMWQFLMGQGQTKTRLIASYCTPNLQRHSGPASATTLKHEAYRCHQEIHPSTCHAWSAE